MMSQSYAQRLKAAQRSSKVKAARISRSKSFNVAAAAAAAAAGPKNEDEIGIVSLHSVFDVIGDGSCTQAQQLHVMSAMSCGGKPHCVGGD
jgi:hypothetical protein